jgi:hypothetical protein
VISRIDYLRVVFYHNLSIRFRKRVNNWIKHLFKVFALLNTNLLHDHNLRVVSFRNLHVLKKLMKSNFLQFLFCFLVYLHHSRHVFCHNRRDLTDQFAIII